MITFGGDKIWGVPDAGLADRHTNTVHYTLVFNAFVMMQVQSVGVFSIDTKAL